MLLHRHEAIPESTTIWESGVCDASSLTSSVTYQRAVTLPMTVRPVP